MGRKKIKELKQRVEHLENLEKGEPNPFRQKNIKKFKEKIKELREN